MDEVLKPFIEDLKKLENVISKVEFFGTVMIHLSQLSVVQDKGVTFHTADGPLTFRGTVSVCSADNPASYDLGGFKNLTAALRKCRYCLAIKEDMISKVIFAFKLEFHRTQTLCALNHLV